MKWGESKMPPTALKSDMGPNNSFSQPLFFYFVFLIIVISVHFFSLRENIDLFGVKYWNGEFVLLMILQWLTFTELKVAELCWWDQKIRSKLNREVKQDFLINS